MLAITLIGGASPLTKGENYIGPQSFIFLKNVDMTKFKGKQG